MHVSILALGMSSLQLMLDPWEKVFTHCNSCSVLESKIMGSFQYAVLSLNSSKDVTFCAIYMSRYLRKPRGNFVAWGQGFTDDILPKWFKRFNWKENFTFGGNVVSDSCSRNTWFSRQNMEETVGSLDGFGSTQKESADWSFDGSGSIQRESTGLPILHSCSRVEENLSKDVSAPPLRTETEVLLANYIPVYVMLPLDVVSMENILSNVEFLNANMRALKAAHADGIMVDVWWGIVEAAGPKQYDWSAYRALFQLIQDHGLKLQVVMSFHQCGGNTGDICYIPLPQWILEIGELNPDIYFTNRDGKRNKEYLSFGIDNEPVLNARTALEVYSDFMKSFRENMCDFLESGMITEIEVGLGPAGELRYPSYPESHGWRFPGIGEFQCYDNYLLSDLKEAAGGIGQNEWGYSGPHDAGRYNDWPQTTGFFCNHGSFATDYGRFFLEWYSNVLMSHGDRILEVAANTFAGFRVKLATKVAGIHWWYNSRNHAAELAAGYYNLREKDGYKPIAKMLARYNAVLNFTCIEMRDDEQYWEARCGPESLVQQVLNAGWNEMIEVSCENALPRYDRGAFAQILRNARPDGISKSGSPRRRISSFTFLRLCQELMQENNWREFNKFVKSMHAGLDYHPEPEKYFRPRTLLELSKPLEVPPEVLIPVASVPLDPCHVPFAPKRHLEPFFSTDAPGGGLGVQLEETDVPSTCNMSSASAQSLRKTNPIRVSNDTSVEAFCEDLHSVWKEFPGFLL